MLDSLAELILSGLLIAWVFRKIHLPELIGLLILGALFGPYVLRWLNPSLLDVSGELRMAALIVILLRAGFELNLKSMKSVGRPSILLRFVPATIEAFAIMITSHWLLNLSYLEGAILGSVLGAVSPAVVVPYMIEFSQKRLGTNKNIPAMVIAASSIDDVFVIVVYSVLLGIYVGANVNLTFQIASIPISIVLGILIGILAGIILIKVFDKYKLRATKMALVILAVSVLMVRSEHLLQNIVPFASLLGVMTLGFMFFEKREKYANAMSGKFEKIWVAAQIVLFTLVGSQVNIQVAWKSGLAGIAVITNGLIARSIGTYLSLLGTNLNNKERLFVVIAYLPKATVQAAIGAAPLLAMQQAGMDTLPGEVILAVAVLSILYTAPLGALAIALSGPKLLTQEHKHKEIKKTID